MSDRIGINLAFEQREEQPQQITRDPVLDWFLTHCHLH